MTRTSFVIALVAVAMLGGCEHSDRATEAAKITPAPGQSSAATPADTYASASGTADADADGNVILQDNDRAIAENKRMIAALGRYQSQDFAKYEGLRKRCEAQVQGTLADSSAPAVARCIEAGW